MNEVIRRKGSSTQELEYTGLTIDDNNDLILKNQLRASAQATNETIVTQASDLSGNLDGLYTIKSSLTVENIRWLAGANVFIEIGKGLSLGLTGTGSLIGDGTSTAGSLISISGGTIYCTGVGAKLFDTDGAIMTVPSDVGSTSFLSLASGQSAGECINSALSVDLNRVIFSDFTTGLSIDTLGFSLVFNTVLFSSPANLVGPAITVGSGVPLGDVSGFQANLPASQSIFKFDNSFVGTASISKVKNFNPATNFFDPTGLDDQSIYISVDNSSPYKNTTASIEATSFNMSTTTDIPAQGALVMMNGAGFVGDEANRFTVDSAGVAEYIGLDPKEISLDGNMLIEPVASAKQLGCGFFGIMPTQYTVAFTNATNLINEVGTAVEDGDCITFYDNGGTLPTGLTRTDVMYFVVNKNIDDFQVSYTLGGTALTFTSDGSGTNQYKIASQHGSIPQTPISANNPRNLVPQGLKELVTGEKVTMFQVNLDDSVDIVNTDGYYRLIE